MNLTNLFFHPTHSTYAYQPLNQQDCVIDEAVDITNEENPYNEPAPLAACRTGNLAWLNEELSRDASVVHRDYRSRRNGHMVPLLYLAVQNGHKNIVKKLIEAGADVNQVTEGGATPLLCATAKDDTELAGLLIDKGADLNLSRKDGTTPLILAAEKGDTELAELLIDKGADVNLSRKDGVTPLFFAVQIGHSELVGQLIEKGADINHTMKDGATPLLLAAGNGHRNIVRFLLEAGADPTKKRVVQGRFLTRSVSPKYVARHIVKDESIVGMIRAVLKNRSIATFRHNPYHEAAPMAACRTGNLEWLNEAIAKDKSVVLRLYRSGTSTRNVPLLKIATQEGHIEIVKRLIDAGADVNNTGPASFSLKKTLTPLAVAAAKGRPDMVNLLLEHGARIDQSNARGTPPLSFAVIYGHLNVVKQLIRHGADINKADKNGKTPLLIAASLGHSEVIKDLIAHGADINRADKTGATPLFDAACFGHLKAAELLIKHGAQVNMPAKDNATPFYMAAQNGHKEVVNCLLAAGADPSIKWHLWGSVLTKSPKRAARIHTHDVEMAETISAAVKQKSTQRALSERAPSEECLLFTNSSSGK